MSSPEQPPAETAGADATADDLEARFGQLVQDFEDLVRAMLANIAGRAERQLTAPRPSRFRPLAWARSVPARIRENGSAQTVSAFGLVFVIVSFLTVFFYFHGPPSGSFDTSNLQLPASAACPKTKSAPTVTVSPAAGAGAVMNILIGRQGDREQGETEPLAIQKGTLCPGSILAMTPGAFTRSDGETLQASQLLSWAQVGGGGTSVTVFVVVAPHHGLPPGAGAYSGSVSLDTPQAEGAKVPVRVHIQYQNLRLVAAFAAWAAFGGFIWAWLLHGVTGGENKQGYFVRHLALCGAVILAAAIPILNVQVLSKPDWQGSATQYIGLATLVGAAAIAATPTLRALVLPLRLGTEAKS